MSDLGLGLSEIFKIFNTNPTKLAKELNLSRYTVYDWVKLRRKIPAERLNQLSNYFEVPREYFLKELSDSEKLEVQLIKINQDKVNTELSIIIQEELEKERLLSTLREQMKHKNEVISILSEVSHLLSKSNTQNIEALVMFLTCFKELWGGNPFRNFNNDELGKELFLLLKKHDLVSGELD